MPCTSVCHNIVSAFTSSVSAKTSALSQKTLYTRSKKKYYKLTIMGRTGKKNPRLGQDFLIWADAENIIKIILNTYAFVNAYISPDAPAIIFRWSSSFDQPYCRTAWIYHSLSWTVRSASRMTTFCVQPMVMASASTSGALSYAR